ncbi:MAG: hypothetical protein ABSD08_13785 [Xanthobacteraceae bacterium]
MLFTMLLSLVGVAVRQRLEHPDDPDVELLASEMILRMLGVAQRTATELPRLVLSKYSNEGQPLRREKPRSLV